MKNTNKKIVAELTEEAISNLTDIYFEQKIKVRCPECSTDLEIDFTNDEYEYIVYPAKDESNQIFFECDGCEETYSFPCVVRSVKVEIEYDDTNIKKVD